jgi:hypothetical protein
VLDVASAYFPNVLTDDEIDSLAQGYVRKRYGPVLPGIEPLWVRRFTREFDLQEPPGAYFTVRLVSIDLKKSGSDGAKFGDGGFFVDRRTGAVRHFAAGELLHASDAVNNRGAIVGAAAPDLRKAVKYILTHSTATLQPNSDVLLGQRATMRWWEFWK